MGRVRVEKTAVGLDTGLSRTQISHLERDRIVKETNWNGVVATYWVFKTDGVIRIGGFGCIATMAEDNISSNPHVTTYLRVVRFVSGNNFQNVGSFVSSTLDFENATASAGGSIDTNIIEIRGTDIFVPMSYCDNVTVFFIHD